MMLIDVIGIITGVTIFVLLLNDYGIAVFPPTHRIGLWLVGVGMIMRAVSSLNSNDNVYFDFSVITDAGICLICYITILSGRKDRDC